MLAGAALADEPGITVSANRNQIYFGESVILQVKVSATQQSEPDLSALKDFHTKFRGSEAQSYFNLSFINGQTRKESFTGRIFTYELTPTNAGEFIAGPVTVTIDGKEYRADGPRITVTGIEQQDAVKLSIVAARTAVLVDEAFDVTLTILAKRLQSPNADIDPFDPGTPPLLTVDYLDGRPIDGLKVPDLRPVLQSILVPRERAGFSINNYTVRANPFDSRGFPNFDDFFQAQSQPARFALPRTAVEEDGKPYWAYTLTLSYQPQQEGNYTFGPAVFKGPTILGADKDGHPVGKDIFAVGPACTVRVVPPPEQDRPISYIGTLGRGLTAEATLDTQTCKVGDPLTLTLGIWGDVRLDLITPPRLTLQTNLLTNFAIYDDTVEAAKTDGKREYRYKVRPTQTGTIEFPPILVSYYDIGARAYKTVSTRPIPVRANPATEFAQEQIIGNTNPVRSASF